MKRKVLCMMLTMALVISTLSMTGCAKTDAGETNRPAESQNGAAESVEGTAAPAESKDVLDQIKEKGYITVAMEGTWAPWTYHDEADNLVGYDVEVAKLIADYIGVEVQYVAGEWDGLLAGLQTGRFDMMVNGVDWTEERAETFDFSDPYCYERTVIIVKGSNTDINSFEDLDGKTTTNSMNSTYMLVAESYGATCLGVDSLNDTIDMVLSGRAEATLNAKSSFYDYMKEHPEADLKIAAESEEATRICIPVQKGDQTATLREAINEAIKEAAANGTLAELSEKYFATDMTKAE